MRKLAVITTHPVQYNAPLFSLLAERQRLNLKVFYTWGQAGGKVYDPDFGIQREWDIPLLNGYGYEFVENIASDPGSHHFSGINNPGLVKKIIEYNPDAILVYGWSFKSHLKILRHFGGKVKILFRGDSTLMDEGNGFSIKKIARRFFLKWVYKKIDTALYTGIANMHYFLAHGLQKHQLVFAPHAVDMHRYQHSSVTIDRLPLKIADTEMVFVFAGKMEKKKDPLLLLQAFKALKAPAVHLLFVGNGDMENKLKSEANWNNSFSQNNIHFLPFQNQGMMPAVYKLADVFVLPSGGPGETWGLSVNEAMACSRAVLVSDKCGCAGDLIKEGVNGYKFESGNANDLIAKMQLFIKRKDELPEMGRQSFRIIGQWNFEKICAAIEGVVLEN